MGCCFRKQIDDELIKEIDLYQQSKYAAWSSGIMERAMLFLKEKILVKAG